jgi:exodeoxyribonuclease V beta subunit
MTEVNNFDLLNSPLDGTNLIEASAGTGKTHAITSLYIRLVLEKNLPVSQILVVTFTDAATEELKDRIRKKLREAIGAFSGDRNDDAWQNGLLRKTKNSKTALRRLNEALRGFDQAAIFTIHGFCRRMLHENAFESGSLFDTELVSDQEKLKQEIVDDFWRKHFYEASPLFVNYALNNDFSPDNLLSLLSNSVSQPYLRIIPETRIPDSSQQENEFIMSFKDISKAWQSAKVEVEEILTTYEGLNRNRYRKANIPIWIQSMDHYVKSHGHNPVLFKGFEKFAASEIEISLKNNYAPPVHPFFECCERLKKAFDNLEEIFKRHLLGLKIELFHYAKNELTRKKGERNIQSFDDLLLKLHKALEGKSGVYLAGAIRARFKAALIDEFQDTDPVQYAIFKRIFGTEDRILFLIGDPKQAIYGFRGADIFAYMKAKGDAKSQYTLSENWRSDPDLIAAINAVFTQTEHPFVYDEIPFQQAVPAERKNSTIIRLNGKSEPPLQLWFVDAGKITGSEKPLTKAKAREVISQAVAAEISRLLRPMGKVYTLDHSYEEHRREPIRYLRESDIAVLVRTNAESRLMQEALTSLHIPSVLFSTGDLFDTHEAMEMERLLAAIVEPSNERLLRAGLTTDIMGVGGEKIYGLLDDETDWENWLVKFKTFHDLWNERGFIRMFRYLLIQEKVLPRLMSLPDGERRNTNLLHLLEVLHRKSVEKKFGMADLLKWLSEQRDGRTSGFEEHPLRLESDENAVKLVTIHKSKGLEYPIAFCPFTWDGSRMKRPKDPFMFHDEAHGMTLTLDLGSAHMDENRPIAEKEILAENLRLLYVALTRAKNRCYFIWGRFNTAETSAPAYLLHFPESWKAKNIVDALAKKFAALHDEDVLSDLRIAVDKTGGSIGLSDMPVAQGRTYAPLPVQEESLTCRHFSGNIDFQWRISSFSSLVSGRRHADELPDRDAISLPETYDQKDFEESDTEEPISGIFSFPRGAKAGTFLHGVLEHLDFTEAEPNVMKALVADKLREYRFESSWLDIICGTITTILNAPIDPETEELKFSCVQNTDRLNELEFYFPLKPISQEKLNMILKTDSRYQLPAGFPETIERLQFSPIRGFMKGFMDLVFQWQDRFYLVDWKSNFLGGRIEDYDQVSLTQVMKKEGYVLQYCIYTLALDQYLRLRMADYHYEKHFGGVYYIFLRGVYPEMGPDFGIYRDVPSPELMSALREGLIE